MNEAEAFRIIIPSELNEKNTINFSSYLRNIVENPLYLEYKFDFNHVKKAYPFGILLLASLVINFQKLIKKKNNDTKFLCEYNNNSHGIGEYLKHIGFFQFIGFDIGKKPGEANGSDTYIPIITLYKEDLLNRSRKHNRHFGEEIIIESFRIANIVSSIYENLDEDNIEFLESAIAYCCREIIRNVFEHSGVDSVTVFAQSFHNLKKVEVCIMDSGIGIHSTLEKKYNTQTPIESLNKAIEPGVSMSNLDKDTGNIWQNSGFGLYVISEICKRINDSIFCIASGNAKLQIEGAEIYCKEYQKRWMPGTIVMFSLGGNNDFYFGNILENIITDGEKIAKSEGRTCHASKMSKTWKFNKEDIN